MRMLVSLLDPPGTRLVGTVSDVKPGQSLSLQNGRLLTRGSSRHRTIAQEQVLLTYGRAHSVVTVGSNQHIGFLDLHATNILDIQQHQDADQPRTARAPAPAPAVVAPPPQPDILKAPLGDPAIVSVGRRPGSVPKPVMETSLHGVSEDARASHVRQAPLVKVESASRDTTPTAPPIARFQSLDISGVPGPSADSLRPTTVDDVNARTTSPKKKKRSGKKARIIPTEESIDSSPVAQSKQPGKGKGWRQTPMLQSTASFQPYNALKKDRRRRETNGWASEDATDVQEMGDFDFESSLAKFDKRGIFDQMRKDDQIDEADRLVSHNRLPRPKPGTAGGKNYHYSEMVLDPAPSSSKAREVSNDFWNSEADDSMVQDERHSGREQASSRTSRRGDSKMSSSRRSQSRKASTAASVGQGSINRVNSGVRLSSL